MTLPPGAQRISTGFTPRTHQQILYNKMRRFNVLVMHRRFGKTVFSLNYKLTRALKNPLKRPQYAYLAPNYGQAKRIAWQYLKDYAGKIPGSFANEAELRVDIPRPSQDDFIRIMLLGAENPDSLRGLYLDGAILDEYAQMAPSTWSEVIRPTLSDRLGWAIIMGTPKGQNDFYDKYQMALRMEDPEWFSALYKASETGIISKEELESLRKTMTEEEYEQEYECSFNAGITGAYFGKELTKAEKEGRITRIPYDPMLPVDTYWDLGINDTTVVWFIQTFRGRHRLIDYYEVCGLGVPEIVAEVKRKPYSLGEWVFPHDVMVRDFSTGKARIQVFNNLGCRPNRVVPKVGTKMESINAARMIFNTCEFDAVKCEKGLKALANYQRKWNDNNQVFEDRPLHNWASNGADAFQQFAMGSRQDSRVTLINGERHVGTELLQAETDYDLYA